MAINTETLIPTTYIPLDAADTGIRQIAKFQFYDSNVQFPGGANYSLILYLKPDPTLIYRLLALSIAMSSPSTSEAPNLGWISWWPYFDQSSRGTTRPEAAPLMQGCFSMPIRFYTAGRVNGNSIDNMYLSRPDTMSLTPDQLFISPIFAGGSPTIQLNWPTNSGGTNMFEVNVSVAMAGYSSDSQPVADYYIRQPVV